MNVLLVVSERERERESSKKQQGIVYSSSSIEGRGRTSFLLAALLESDGKQMGGRATTLASTTCGIIFDW